MDAELRPRLPLDHPDRIKARDLKLHLRDCERANRNGLSRYRCPCNLCGGALRGWTQVMNFTAPVNVVSYTLLFENLLLCPGIYVMVVVPFLLLTNSF
jgi:hypothetical protein